jgi:hypothetical protein
MTSFVWRDSNDFLSAEELFLFAVQAVFERWTALRLALADSWAGPDTAERVAALADDLVILAAGQYSRQDGTLMTYTKSTVVTWLADFFADDCSADIEDGSVEEVAQVLDQLRAEIWQAAPCSVHEWRQLCPCLAQLTDRLRAEREQRDRLLAPGLGAGPTEALSDQESSSDGETRVMMDATATEGVCARALDDQTGDDSSLPLIDEDGFQRVVSRRYRHR